MCKFTIEFIYSKIAIKRKFFKGGSFNNQHIQKLLDKIVIFSQMDSLVKASQNFEQVSNEFDEKLFVEFTKKITIWDFFGISKEQYLAIPEQEKRVKISQYYSDMKSKQSTGELCLLFV